MQTVIRQQQRDILIRDDLNTVCVPNAVTQTPLEIPSFDAYSPGREQNFQYRGCAAIRPATAKGGSAVLD